MTTEEKLLKLTSRLDAIAKKNDDQFTYSIDIIPRIVKKFTFEAKESSDYHTLIIGSGTTIEEALEKAEAQIPDFLKSWGYVEA